jgi:hypothetical protein
MIIFHNALCLEDSSPGHSERPERIAHTAPLLKDRHPDSDNGVPARARGLTLQELPVIVFFIISQESVREFGAKLRRKPEQV